MVTLYTYFISANCFNLRQITMFSMKPYFVAITLLLVLACVLCENKYSKEANTNFKSQFDVEPNVQLRHLDKPFRMGKLNLLWKKAQVRLSEPKLKSIYNELKIHDKEEITYKKVKSDGLDADGQKEGSMRKRLVGIMSTYGLLEHFEDIQGEVIKLEKDANSPDFKPKAVFKDKKLNKLWEKAEHSGFTSIELQALKEEFSHHQDKVDQYYSLLDEVEAKPDDSLNSIDHKLEKFNTLEELDTFESNQNEHFKKADILRQAHQEIKDGYDRLHRISLSGPESREFVEPRVQVLWSMAQKGNFSNNELESMRVELHHYEKRLLKLRHLQAEAALDTNDIRKVTGEKIENDMNEVIKKQQRKVEKYHQHLESKITKQHMEL
uniref:Alpha-2-macroglobulin receptor-associated protein n=1 Tax=Cacopsylla melanoneura TaxID=428564 RepID=A0A8D9AL89_9HEMI